MKLVPLFIYKICKCKYAYFVIAVIIYPRFSSIHSSLFIFILKTQLFCFCVCVCVCPELIGKTMCSRSESSHARVILHADNDLLVFQTK